MGTLLHSYAKVREAIEVSFDVVSGIGQGIVVLDGVHIPQGEGEVLGVFLSIALNGILEFILKRMCLTCALKVYNISVWIHQWKCCLFVSLNPLMHKVAKMVT